MAEIDSNLLSKTQLQNIEASLHFTTTYGQVKLVNIQSGDSLDIQFAPQEIETNRTSKVDSVQIIGRNFPHYQGVSGARKLDLKLDFYAERSQFDIHNKVRWLEALTFNESFQESRPTILILFGENFTDSRFTVEGDVKTTYYDFDASNNYAPRRATCSLTLCQEHNGIDLKRSDWKNGNY